MNKSILFYFGILLVLLLGMWNGHLYGEKWFIGFLIISVMATGFLLCYAVIRRLMNG